MRLDKFLKLSRLVKRRTLAKEMCDKGRIAINGHTSKAGSTVSVGDEMTIRYGQRLLTVRVELLSESPRKEEATRMYDIVSEQSLT